MALWFSLIFHGFQHHSSIIFPNFLPSGSCLLWSFSQERACLRLRTLGERDWRRWWCLVLQVGRICRVVNFWRTTGGWFVHGQKTCNCENYGMAPWESWDGASTWKFSCIFRENLVDLLELHPVTSCRNKSYSPTTAPKGRLLTLRMFFLLKPSSFFGFLLFCFSALYCFSAFLLFCFCALLLLLCLFLQSCVFAALLLRIPLLLCLLSLLSLCFSFSFALFSPDCILILNETPTRQPRWHPKTPWRNPNDKPNMKSLYETPTKS